MDHTFDCLRVDRFGTPIKFAPYTFVSWRLTSQFLHERPNVLNDIG